MKDAHDDQTDSLAERTDEPSAGHPVPEDAEWEQVAQESVDQTKPDDLTTAIVYAVADAEGVSPKHVKSPPLYDIIDTAALEAAVFGSGRDSSVRDRRCSTEFMYRGYRVLVQTDGWVQIYERVDG